jgi:hypothetical protein
VSLRDLQMLFAQCYAQVPRTERTRHLFPGAHFKGKGHTGVYRQPNNPAGSKLLRKFQRDHVNGARGY